MKTHLLILLLLFQCLQSAAQYEQKEKELLEKRKQIEAQKKSGRRNARQVEPQTVSATWVLLEKASPTTVDRFRGRQPLGCRPRLVYIVTGTMSPIA